MAKKSKYTKKTYAYKGWKQDSVDGRYLVKLFKSGKLTPAAMPSLIRELHPRFRLYKYDSFSSGLRRLKAKLGLNTRSK